MIPSHPLNCDFLLALSRAIPHLAVRDKKEPVPTWCGNRP